MSASPNGCTCADVRSLAASDGGEPMPPEWRCISCRGRAEAAKAGHVCRRCGVGDGGGMCTECQWAIEDGQ